MNTRRVVILPDAELLARAAGTRLLLALLDAQSLRHAVHVALTGGTIGTALLAAVRDEPLLRTVDWSGVHLWWGDERFLPTGDQERNDTQARQALLGNLPIPEDHVHSIPGPDRVLDVEEAAQAYAAELQEHAGEGAEVPEFAVTLLGVGPDGHIASLFPGKKSVTVSDAMTVPELDSPKPPSQRVSLTLPALGASHQVWLVASGTGKAPAVAAGLAGGESPEVAGAPAPAGLVAGQDLTLWLLDTEAAASLPAS